MTEAVLGLLTAVVSLATALVSVFQLRRQRQREALPPPVHPYYGQYPPAPPSTGATGPTGAYYDPVPTGWPPQSGSYPPTSPGYGPETSPAAPAPAGTQARRRPEVWAAVRDASLIFAASAILGGVLVLAGGDLSLETVTVLNIACLLVGFTISAVAARGNRARHLLIAALVMWALSLLNVAVGVAPLLSWVFALPLIAGCAAVAGLLSLIFKRPRG